MHLHTLSDICNGNEWFVSVTKYDNLSYSELMGHGIIFIPSRNNNKSVWSSLICNMMITSELFDCFEYLIEQSIHHHHHHSINILHGMSSCYAYEKSLKTLSGMVMVNGSNGFSANELFLQTECGTWTWTAEHLLVFKLSIYLKHEDERIVIASLTLLHTWLVTLTTSKHFTIALILLSRFYCGYKIQRSCYVHVIQHAFVCFKNP